MDQEFIQIITQNEGILYKVCKLYCQNQEDRKDLFQDILLHLWQSYPSFQAKSKVSTWIYRIALNTAISRFRKQKKQDLLAPLDQVSNHQISCQIPPWSDESEDKWEVLYRAIEKLSPIDKAIIVLYLEDHSYEQMSHIIGVSASNIGFKLNKIKERLRKTIN